MTALEFAISLVAIFLALSVIMAGAWFVQQRTGNSGWVDMIWTFGVGATGLAAALVPLADGPWPSLRQGITAALVIAWSLRLGLHIAQRSAEIADDPRYAEMIKGWGAAAPRQMFWLLQKQAWVSVPLALAIFLAAQNPAAGFRLQDVLAVVILVIAIGGEALADLQLRRFKAGARKAAVCDSGLWRWSRHPNYFFEWTVWLAYPLLAIDLAGGYAWGYLALLAPACMYWLLVHVSGIPPLERHMMATRGDAFRAYRARTSAFFPWPPRS